MNISELTINLGGRKNINSVDYNNKNIEIKVNKSNLVKRDSLNEQLSNNYQLGINNNTITISNNLKELYENLETELEKKEENAGRKILGVISEIFAPVLSVLAATGLIKGLLALLVFLNLINQDSGTYLILYALGDSFFYFFPVFLGYTAAKRFGCNPFVGIVIGLSLVYPTITALSDQDALYSLFTGTLFEAEVYTSFLGIPVILPPGGYVSTVVPIIFSVYFASLVEQFWDRIIPDLVKSFLVPTLTLLIIVPLTFIVVGPIASVLSSIIQSIAEFLYNLSPLLEGLFIGLLWQILVIFGLHWAIVPIMILNLSSNGFDSFVQPFFAASFAQTAVCIGIYFKTKDKDLKELAIPAIISGLFGITEPAIYGITLPRIKYFIISCIGAGIGGAIIGFTRVKVFIYGAMGIFGFPSYINPANGDVSNVINVLIAVVVASLFSFLVTYFTYKDNQQIDTDEFGSNS